MAASRIVEELDHPLFFGLFYVAPIAIVASAIYLWIAKNTNQNGLTRLIQQN